MPGFCAQRAGNDLILILGKRHYHCPQPSNMFRGPTMQAQRANSNTLLTAFQPNYQLFLRLCCFFYLEGTSHVSV